MNSNIRQLVYAAEETARIAKNAQAALDGARQRCQHQWSKTEYTPIRTEGYRTQSLMGHFTVDQYGHVDAPEVYIPSTEKPQWTRVCAECGLRQITDKVEEQVTRTPKF